MYVANKAECAKLLQSCRNDNMQQQIIFQCSTKNKEHIKSIKGVMQKNFTLVCDCLNILSPPTGKKVH
jgi:hypothetical protein